MKLNCMRHRTWLFASLWGIVLVAAACAPDATQLILSPRLGEQLPTSWPVVTAAEVVCGYRWSR